MAKLINFRCPENLEADIAKIGLKFYPKEIKDETKDRGYDLTATMLAILGAGIGSITSQGLCLTEDKTERNTASITSHKTEDITELKTAIAELQTNFENQLGEFKSLVFDTSPTLDGMNAAIAPLVKRIESLENANRNYPDLKEKINSLETAIKSNSESGVTKELLETVTEGKPEKKTITEIMPSENAPVSLETDNQDKIPIEDTKQPETMDYPLLDGFPVISDSQCPFEVGQKYTQQELMALFSAKYGSDIINWIEKGVKSRNPVAQKYSHCFTFEGEGKTKLYTFNGL